MILQRHFQIAEQQWYDLIRSRCQTCADFVYGQAHYPCESNRRLQYVTLSLATGVHYHYGQRHSVVRICIKHKPQPSLPITRCSKTHNPLSKRH